MYKLKIPPGRLFTIMKMIVVIKRPKSMARVYIKRDLLTFSKKSGLPIIADSTRNCTASEKLKGIMKMKEVNALTKVIAPRAETPK